jgi:hypothetical protein
MWMDGWKFRIGERRCREERCRSFAYVCVSVGKVLVKL